MKARSSQKQRKSSARKQASKVNMCSTARGLTSQAGLLPIVKYLGRIGFEKIVRHDVPHKRVPENAATAAIEAGGRPSPLKNKSTEKSATISRK